MEQIGNDFECQQSVERCANKSSAKKEEQTIFEELMQFCDISIDENLSEAMHSRVEDDAVAFLLAHINAEQMVSSLNEKSPVPFKALNWSNLDRFRRKAQMEAKESTPEVGPSELQQDLQPDTAIPKRDPSSSNFDDSSETDASDSDFDPVSTEVAPIKERPKIRSKPRVQPSEPPKMKIKKVAKPKKKIRQKRGRKSKGNPEPTSSSTIEIDQEVQWINKTNNIWSCLFHKVGGRVYGSGRNPTKSPNTKGGLIWTQRYICLTRGPNDEPCQARVIMSVYTNDPGSILVREYQYHSHQSTSDLLKPEE